MHATRWAAAVALALMLGTASTAAGVTIFGDRFNRADGAVGGSWSASNGLGLPAAAIAGLELCADDHGFAKFAGPLTATNVRVSYTFQADADENFEVYAVAIDDGGGVHLAGCSGGGAPAACGPKVQKIGEAAADGTPIAMTADTTYGVTAAFYDDGGIDLTITTAGGALLGTLSANTGGAFREYGLVIGRQADSNLTCVNDFTIEDLDDTVLFSDDFNRADGPLGMDWGSIGADELEIASQAACGTRPMSGGEGAISAWVGEVSPAASITAIVDFFGGIVNEQYAGVIFGELTSKYLLTGLEEDSGSSHLRVATGIPGSAPSFLCPASDGFSLASGVLYRLFVQRDPDGTTIARVSETLTETVLGEVDCDTGPGDYDRVLLTAGGQTVGNTTCTDDFVLHAAAAQEPVDCVVSDWGDFGACSASCGGGTQTRTRTVITPASGGGAECPELEESQPCNTDPCDNPGFVPPNKDVLKCEQGLAKNVGKVLACYEKCQNKSAKDSAFDAAVCRDTCDGKLGGSIQKSVDKGICPSCLDSTGEHHALSDTALTVATDRTAEVYCQVGAVDAELKCEQKIGKALVKLGQCYDKCHSKQAAALLKGKTFDEPACKTGCRAKYDKLSAKLVEDGGCPACLGATEQSDIADEVQSERDDSKGSFYCDGTVALP